ncbi:MAG: enoyl-CoA hydratase-related protein, partial [Gammaproteobacteria bacterium]|nr:enoyl-CoA hydratase-related protein [Gammaproteobacteria bacterium]
ERAGLVARIVPAGELLESTLEIAQAIAGKSLPSVMACKESVNRSFESALAEGLLFERRQFHALFATEDQKEGMSAFAEKREAQWKHR